MEEETKVVDPTETPEEVSGESEVETETPTAVPAGE